MKPLPPPTPEERKAAAEAAKALRVALDGGEWGKPSTVHFSLSRPRRGVWMTTWANLPGFRRTGFTYQHDLLPGWSYRQSEVKSEMIPDLEALAEHGVRPTEATS